MGVLGRKKPLCDLCMERESLTICGYHHMFLCRPCSDLHRGPECFFNAAPAAFLLSRDKQLPFPLGVEGFDL